jgi:hypothetical protein
MGNAHSITAERLPPFTSKTPEFRELLKSYWESHNNGVSQLDYTSLDQPSSGVYAEFYRANGYLASSVPHEDEMLDNDVHPIFGKLNWIMHLSDFDRYHTLILPALRLASKFLEDPHMLKFWIYLRYGDAAFVNGWVGIAESPREHDPKIVEKIKGELRNVLGKVEFMFVMSKDMVQGAEAACTPDLCRVCEIFEDRAKTAGLARPKGVWHNPWAKQQRPTILLSIRDYWLAFEKMPPALQLKWNFHRAWVIMHELAHALSMLWRPEISRKDEPIMQPSDRFPEAGL